MSFDDTHASSRTAISDIACDNTAGAAEMLRRAGDVYAELMAEHRDRVCLSAEHAMRRVIQASVALLCKFD